MGLNRKRGRISNSIKAMRKYSGNGGTDDDEV